jgi:hypothetical protein
MLLLKPNGEKTMNANKPIGGKGTKNMLVAKEVARLLGSRLAYIYSEIWANKIPGAQKVGKIWFIPAEAVEQRLRAREDRKQK